MADPLVLLPGFMCDARLYDAQIADLGRDHVIVVAPVWEGERIEEIASGLLPKLPQRFALCGHSLGALVAIEILRRAPERVTRIALMSLSALPESPAYSAAREPRIVAARSGRIDEVMAQEVPNEALAGGVPRSVVRAQLLEMAEDLGGEVFYRETRAMQRRPDQHSVLRKAKQPMLVLCGAHDTIYPVKRHEFIAEFLPYTTLKVIDSAGHLPPLEAPGEVNAALRDWMQQPLVLR